MTKIPGVSVVAISFTFGCLPDTEITANAKKAIGDVYWLFSSVDNTAIIWSCYPILR